MSFFLHTIDFYQRHDYQGIIKSNVKLNFFVPLHQHVSLLFFHHSAYHSEWLSWPCLCNFFTIISITYAEIVTSKNQLRHPKLYCITCNGKCKLYLFDSFVQQVCKVTTILCFINLSIVQVIFTCYARFLIFQ